MVEEIFKCSDCGLNQKKDFLASILKGNVDLKELEQEIEEKSSLWRDFEAKYNQSVPGIIRQSYATRMATLDKEIAELTKKAEGSQRPVCIFCITKGRQRVDVASFTCEFCKQKKQGSGLKRHIGGWEADGIYPQYLLTVCRQCVDDYALSAPADFFCPRTSDGRDDYSSNGKSVRKFDCSCTEQDNVLPDRPFKDVF